MAGTTFDLLPRRVVLHPRVRLRDTSRLAGSSQWALVHDPVPHLPSAHGHGRDPHLPAIPRAPARDARAGRGRPVRVGPPERGVVGRAYRLDRLPASGSELAELLLGLPDRVLRLCSRGPVGSCDPRPGERATPPVAGRRPPARLDHVLGYGPTVPRRGGRGDAPRPATAARGRVATGGRGHVRDLVRRDRAERVRWSWSTGAR